MLQDSHIALAHGNGGRYMRELIEEIFVRHLGNGNLDVHLDAAPIPALSGELMVTTDGFTVKPLEFPGGDIGSLAVHGTVNDLAVSGATPWYLTLNAFIEEGLEIARLDRLIASMARAAREAGVCILAGDTKVVARGEGGGLYLATTGIGVRPFGLRLGMEAIRPGDCLLASGSMGDHGIAVMLAREEFGLRGDLASDAGSVLNLTQALLPFSGLRFMRDPTRGGLATVAQEIAKSSGLRLRLRETAIPVRDQVRAVCEILGYDPLYLACEGKVIAVIAPEQAEPALASWRSLPNGAEAAIIGVVETGDPLVILETELGGARILEELEEDPLPRIC